VSAVAEPPINLYLSRGAMERLLGENTEIRIKAKTQLVNDILGKHLKSVHNSDMAREIKDHMNKFLKEELERQVGYYKENYTGVYCAPENLQRKVQEMIVRAVDQAVAGQLKESLERLFTSKQNFWAAQIEAGIEKALEKNINDAVQTEVMRRLNLAATLGAGGG
jgi:hypothetical protein